MIPDNIKSIMQDLLDAGPEAYIIGGAIRELKHSRVPFGLKDLAISGIQDDLINERSVLMHHLKKTTGMVP